MPERIPLDPSAEWVELVVTDEDWDAAAPHLLTSMLSQLVLIRTFEEFVLELAGEGLIHGPAHSSIGQEGGAVGSAIALTSQDTVTARNLYGHLFDFFPSHKTFVTTNHKPVIRGTDDGIWRRVQLIPFTVAIDKNARSFDQSSFQAQPRGKP